MTSRKVRSTRWASMTSCNGNCSKIISTNSGMAATVSPAFGAWD